MTLARSVSGVNPLGCAIKFESCCESTDATASPSDGDSTSGALSLVSLSESLPPGGQKSVRFSLVQTREYNVVDELAPPGNDEHEFVRRSLGWEFTEKERDLESHQDETHQQRKEKYLQMIQDHIQRAEREKMNRDNEKRPMKKSRMKSKILKPLWKGFLDAAGRSAVIFPTPYR